MATAEDDRHPTQPPQPPQPTETHAGHSVIDSREEECQHLIKAIFVGAAGVGKTCLLERLFSERFSLKTQPTIGCDFRFKKYHVDGKNVGVTLWDTAGSERFMALTNSYFRGSHGVVLVFDVTRRDTLLALQNDWLPLVAEHVSTPGAVLLIVGNKTDLEPRQVSSEEGAEFARHHGCLYKETSAAIQDDNVHDALVW
eukprot:CAMPEP_0119105578 /NCGR_PEP_ID=MMETSP1180-20130426/3498_1 /TAXON_ID=3052 ORGANISM="Chlamydomonas cf sp, Strain CCMP681" /NCGR_SAMPLE_ID=MMETSP1180 /ASSEMBLY_ACC=CAM_ASM_000741 /LENGTH=197 /DNA_ID=CAMNT_0007090659 /DNA_START=57 /DNA_END=647 /DNA_ORIENTATION=-